MLVDMAEKEYDHQIRKKYTHPAVGYRPHKEKIQRKRLVSTWILLGRNRQVYYRSDQIQGHKPIYCQKVIVLVRKYTRAHA